MTLALMDVARGVRCLLCSGKEPGRSRVVGVLAALWVGALALGVSPAPGAFPGGNGRMVFDSDRDGDPDI
jgi:hypothetical protein